MTCITIKHNKDLTNELEELRIKVGQARTSRRVGCAYKTKKEWGVFKYTNYTATKYSNTHFVFMNPKAPVDYFPLQNDKVTISEDCDRITISCLGIDEPFELPPGFIRIRFVHVYHNYILIDYVEANDFGELKEAYVNSTIYLLSYMEERGDLVDTELNYKVNKKILGIQRFIQKEFTKRRANLPIG